MHKALADHPDEYQISLLAISVSNLVDQPVLQLELPLLPDEAERPGSRIGAARWAVDHSIDAVRRRFGRSAVGYASSCCRSIARCPTSSASSPNTSCDASNCDGRLVIRQPGSAVRSGRIRWRRDD